MWWRHTLEGNTAIGDITLGFNEILAIPVDAGLSVLNNTVSDGKEHRSHLFNLSADTHPDCCSKPATCKKRLLSGKLLHSDVVTPARWLPMDVRLGTQKKILATGMF
jgi:hypothetical protein